jgi:hypothetical protein
VKAKKGQILVLVLMLMAVGLIVISPLLAYLNTSYNIYSSKIDDTTAYYTVDAMMGKMFGDMYAGENIYILNASDSTRYNNQSNGGWLNGYKISTSINNSIASPPPPSGSQYADWIYMDPGCAFGLNTLADGAPSHDFNIYLTGGSSVTANWYFKGSGSCDYYCIGKMWIAYPNGSTVTYTNGSPVSIGPTMNGVKTAFQQQLSWTVPQSGSGNYYIKFQNNSKRKIPSGCSTNQSFNMNDALMVVKPTFSGIGETNHTWVRVGNSYGGQVYQYQDYTITTTAKLASTNADILRIVACVRQTPGSLMWWEHQSLAVISWMITYY